MRRAAEILREEAKAHKTACGAYTYWPDRNAADRRAHAYNDEMLALAKELEALSTHPSPHPDSGQT